MLWKAISVSLIFLLAGLLASNADACWGHRARRRQSTCCSPYCTKGSAEKSADSPTPGNLGSLLKIIEKPLKEAPAMPADIATLLGAKPE